MNMIRRFCRVKYGVSRSVSLVLKGAATQPIALLLVGPRLVALPGMVGMASVGASVLVASLPASPARRSRGRATLQNHLLPLPHILSSAGAAPSTSAIH